MSDRTYFSDFSDFTVDPGASLAKEFARLAVHEGWAKKSHTYRQQRQKCYEEEFETQFGRNASKLDSWRALCSEVGISTVPSSITQSKKALAQVHVNICDLIESRRAGTSVKVFKTYQELKKYTKKTGKFYSKETAKENGFLKALLKKF